MAFFSVIIPLYNKEAHIHDTLISVLNQSYTDYEIIVVNDGSTDNSLSEVKKIISEKLMLFDTKNKGVSQARNFAMQQARGDYFAFLDADDSWEPNHLKNLHQLINKYPDCGLYCTNYKFNYGRGYTVIPKFPTLPKQKHWEGIVPDFFKASMQYRIALTSAVAIPKIITNTIGFFDNRFTSGQDTDYWTRIALATPVAFSKKISVSYNASATNRISTTKASNRHFMTFEKFISDEFKNPSLKKFNDLYRVELALKHKIIGDIDTYKYYKKDISPNNISNFNKLLLPLPSVVLNILWHLKQWGKKLKRFFIGFKS